MGTRSLTRFVDDGTEILCLYRQFDGYPNGHGLDLAKILAGSVMVNGMNVYPPGSKDCDEEFTYTITGVAGSEPRIAIDGEGYDDNDKETPAWEGTASEALARWKKGAA